MSSLFMPEEVNLDKLEGLVKKDYSYSDNCIVFAAEKKIYALNDFESEPLLIGERSGKIWGLVEHKGTLYDSWVDQYTCVIETLNDRQIASHRGWSKLYTHDGMLLQAGYEKSIFDCYNAREIIKRDDFIAGLGEIDGILYDITKEREIHETLTSKPIAPKSNLFVTGSCVHNDKFYYSVRTGAMDTHCEIWYFDSYQDFKKIGENLPFETVHLFSHDGMLYHTAESFIFETLSNNFLFDAGKGQITVMESISKKCLGGFI